MTREDALEIEPGPITDRLIAERVMGWKKIRKTTKYETPSATHATGPMNPFIVGRMKHHKWDVEIFHYSTSLFDAFNILEKFRNEGGLVEVEGGLFWLVHITPSRKGASFAGASTLPLAICRAALLAVMEK